MPLRDHFRPPLDNVHSWDELHGMWPAVIVQMLIEVLPEPYFAALGVHLGTIHPHSIDAGPGDVVHLLPASGKLLAEVPTTRNALKARLMRALNR